MQTLRCFNCSNEKSPDRYLDCPYCVDCDTALKEAENYLVAEKITDPLARSQVRQDALARRSPSTRRNSVHPSEPLRLTKAAVDAELAAMTQRLR